MCPPGTTTHDGAGDDGPTDPTPAAAMKLAARWCRIIAGVRESELRACWLGSELRALSDREAAAALDLVCSEADLGGQRSILVVHALVQWVVRPEVEARRGALWTEARARQLHSLERLLRRPLDGEPKTARIESLPTEEAIRDDEPEVRAKMPDYGRGRPLTLGERKALARRPSPELIPKILADPHPDVIRNLLAAPRLTENDVVRLTTRRPNEGRILQEVACHPRWCQRPRIRLTLVLNPWTPTEIVIANLALLQRSELLQVLESTDLHPAVLAAARERSQLPSTPVPGAPERS